MLPETAQSDGNCEAVIDPNKVLAVTQGVWTLKTLGIEDPNQKPFSKDDFKRVLKKVNRKVKK